MFPPVVHFLHDAVFEADELLLQFQLVETSWIEPVDELYYLGWVANVAPLSSCKDACAALFLGFAFGQRDSELSLVFVLLILRDVDVPLTLQLIWSLNPDASIGIS